MYCCRFHEVTGIPFSHMLFFDDEKRNVTSVSELGEYDLHCLCLRAVSLCLPFDSVVKK